MKESRVTLASRVVLSAFVLAVTLAVWSVIEQFVAPQVSSEAAVTAVNGGSQAWLGVLSVEQARKGFECLVLLLMAAVQFCIWWPFVKGVKPAAPALLVAFLLSQVGCMRPYDVPQYIEVASSQSAFVIPLEGESKDQAKFDSASFLESRKVAVKRILVPKRWSQEGRLPNTGQWIPTVRVIIVDRSPVTVELVVANDSKSKGKDNAIWVESADSVGFSVGWSVTAFVREEDAATFLYWYPSGSLASVMASEVRARVQQQAAEVSARWKLDELRGKKNEIVTEVRKDLLEFFSKRGITITTLGMFGGMTYENPDIQTAIDKTFISQQEKVNAKAMLDAQEDKNARVKSEAQACADAARMKAKGEADGIESVNAALAKAANNPQLIQLRQLEVDRARVDKWNGQYPGIVAGEGANAWVGMPSPVVAGK